MTKYSKEEMNCVCFLKDDIIQTFESPNSKFAIIKPIKLENILKPEHIDYLNQRKSDTGDEHL